MVDASAPATQHGGSETLTHLLARVLNQLSLSAWLPSAALVLLVGLALQLGAAVDEDADFGTAMTTTLERLGDLTFSTLVLVMLVIVVSTMLTQAFSFGAIRVLEGYWGAARIPEWLATARARRHRKKRARLGERYDVLVELGHAALLSTIAEDGRAEPNERRLPEFSEAMYQLLEEQVLGKPVPDDFQISDSDRAVVESMDWRAACGPDAERREINLRRRLADYPQVPSHILPTRLGNILRRREDDTGREEVEGFIEAVFDDLPFSLQLAHDEQRTRLDLYCSMVFVIALSAVVAAARFGFQHWPYQVGALLLALVSGCVVYLAALTSARHYGSLLIAIAEHVDAEVPETSRLARMLQRLALR